jgi:hypothetical protein
LNIGHATLVAATLPPLSPALPIAIKASASMKYGIRISHHTAYINTYRCEYGCDNKQGRFPYFE